MKIARAAATVTNDDRAKYGWTWTILTCLKLKRVSSCKGDIQSKDEVSTTKHLYRQWKLIKWKMKFFRLVLKRQAKDFSLTYMYERKKSFLFSNVNIRLKDRHIYSRIWHSKYIKLFKQKKISFKNSWQQISTLNHHFKCVFAITI